MKNGNAKKEFESPRVDVYENESELLLIADIPGVPADALDVQFHDGELLVEGRRAEGTAYRRVFALPDGIDVDHVAARHTNGVLEVRLPKAQEKRARKIEVRTA